LQLLDRERAPARCGLFDEEFDARDRAILDDRLLGSASGSRRRPSSVASALKPRSDQSQAVLQSAWMATSNFICGNDTGETPPRAQTLG
jgi:hypothetical protein